MVGLDGPAEIPGKSVCRDVLGQLGEVYGEHLNGKQGNVLFNDALKTFYLRLCGVGHMVKDHSDSERKEGTLFI